MNWEAIKTMNTVIVTRSTTTLDGYHITAYDFSGGWDYALAILCVAIIFRCLLGGK